jgi:hypothetical protein
MLLVKVSCASESKYRLMWGLVAMPMIIPATKITSNDNIWTSWSKPMCFSGASSLSHLFLAIYKVSHFSFKETKKPTNFLPRSELNSSTAKTVNKRSRDYNFQRWSMKTRKPHQLKHWLNPKNQRNQEIQEMGSDIRNKCRKIKQKKQKKNQVFEIKPRCESQRKAKESKSL